MSRHDVGPSGMKRLTVAIACLLASLSLVAWRQGRAYDLQREVEAVRSEVAAAQDRKTQYEADITFLESREHILEAAERLLGLRSPSGQVRVIRMGED